MRLQSVMNFKYFDIERSLERRRLVKSLIPRFLFLIIRKHQFARRYPDAHITSDSIVRAGAQIGPNTVVHQAEIGETVSIGRFTTVGYGCKFRGKGKITIGTFCSIAPDCLFLSENHITDAVSTYPFEHLLKGREQDYTEYAADSIEVGSDVWIGQRAIILAGAKIGHGSIIAAGAVVPKGEFPPYSVIGGAPAKVIKMRFSQEKIDELLLAHWWEKSESEIFGPLMPFLHRSP